MDKRPKSQGALNPFVAIRRQMQLGQAEFARIIGCSLPALWAAERGTTAKPTIILRGLQELGYDATRLAEQYGEWRSAMLEDERFRLRVALEAEAKDKPDDKQSH